VPSSLVMVRTRWLTSSGPRTMLEKVNNTDATQVGKAECLGSTL
jgi:hypothetical protein